MHNLFIVSIFGNINNINSRVYKLDRAFEYHTTFITTNFDHSRKEFKSLVQSDLSRIKIVYLEVPRYSKNLSFKRVFSHLVFAYKLYRFLNTLENTDKPQILFCLMPTSSAAWVAGRFCKKNKCFFVIDIIDLWPESLIPITQNNLFIKFLVKPWEWLTKRVYKYADYISAESKAYSQIAYENNSDVKASHTYLGVNIQQVNEIIQTSPSKNFRTANEIILCYGGSLNNSYDFDTLLNAIRYIHDKGLNYKMFFFGDGEKRTEIITYSNLNNLNIQVTGRLAYDKFLSNLASCDIAFNPFFENTKVVHSYKFNDYCAAGLFIFNNLRGETAEAVDKYDIGVNYTKKDLSEKLFEVLEKWDFYKEKRNNIKFFIDKELDSQKIYKKLYDDIIAENYKFSSRYEK
jgi:glycosyltransferase involved in cell wall biosynthesis